jgi:hypothetical protein
VVKSYLRNLLNRTVWRQCAQLTILIQGYIVHNFHLCLKLRVAHMQGDSVLMKQMLEDAVPDDRFMDEKFRIQTGNQ